VISEGPRVPALDAVILDLLVPTGWAAWRPWRSCFRWTQGQSGGVSGFSNDPVMPIPGAWFMAVLPNPSTSATSRACCRRAAIGPRASQPMGRRTAYAPLREGHAVGRDPPHSSHTVSCSNPTMSTRSGSSLGIDRVAVTSPGSQISNHLVSSPPAAVMTKGAGLPQAIEDLPGA
jgi:hypothetical protein